MEIGHSILGDVVKFSSLRQYIDFLNRQGELQVIDAPMHPEIEIAKTAAQQVKSGGKALLFTKVEGSDFRLFMNGFGTEKRMAAALGFADLRQAAAKIEKLLSVLRVSSPLQMLQKWDSLLSAACVFPVKTVCQADYIEERTDFFRYPILKTYPKDGGRFITMGLTVLRDPESGKQNIGLYRLQVHDGQTLGMHIHMHKDGARILNKYKQRGERAPVAIAVGCNPILQYAATAPLPEGIDELAFAGFLQGRPQKIIQCRESGLYVPADFEFLFTGYIDMAETKPEGPFGDHTGFYSAVGEYPVFHSLKTVRRADAIFCATVVGKPPMEDYYMGLATQHIFLPFAKMLCPEIADWFFPPEGIFHGCAVISIHTRYPGAAQKVLHFVWGNGQLMFSKAVILVDAAVDPSNRTEVLWRIFNNVDWKRDITVADGPLDVLDHASGVSGAKIGVDATEKSFLPGWPERAEFDAT